MTVFAFAVLLAQNDPISGGAGWVGAGLLGAVLSWLLLVHLPSLSKQANEKDKAVRDWIDEKDKALAAKDNAIQVIIDAKWKMIESMGTNYRNSLKEVTEHCEKEVTMVAAALRENFSSIASTWQHDIGQLTGAINDLSQYIQDRHDEGKA